MRNLTIVDDLRVEKGGCTYEVKFSDNPYTMTYKSQDVLECQAVRATLDERIIKYFKKETNELKTSDLGFVYNKRRA